MSEFLYNAVDIIENIKNQKVTSKQIVSKYFDNIENKNKELNSFIALNKDLALSKANEIDERIQKGKPVGKLAGLPIGIKDNICTEDFETTCGSKILKNWHPPYNATVIKRLTNEDAIIVGKTNLDEFAMGSSTEHSAFGPTKNPLDLTKVPGGSSGGSACAVKADLVPIALGSDTGGSIRQPASFCGIVGMKPTYGLVSRFGLIAFASSLDQIGPFANTVKDCATILDVIAGYDPADSTSLDIKRDNFSDFLDRDLKGMKIGLIKEFNEYLDPEVSQNLNLAADLFANNGAAVSEISLPHIKYSLSTYYLIAPAEASSNLARFDGVRYGLRVAGTNVDEMMINTRTQGFGPEVKRRIMLGTYALSSGYYDAYYGTSQKLRTALISDFKKAYENVDVIITPTTPTGAFKFGAKLEDPLQMYLSDIFTIPSNLAGHPAISIPFGKDDENMPLGIQILSNALDDSKVIQVASILEKLRDENVT
jgi:aspartyl-tRNA(Asn)/glutamyl-tRNA(Gln) amidotransferase subunit A